MMAAPMMALIAALIVASQRLSADGVKEALRREALRRRARGWRTSLAASCPYREASVRRVQQRLAGRGGAFALWALGCLLGCLVAACVVLGAWTLLLMRAEATRLNLRPTMFTNFRLVLFGSAKVQRTCCVCEEVTWPFGLRRACRNRALCCV